MEYKNSNKVVYSCKYHVVWCPKYRRKVLVGSISERLKELIDQKCLEIKADIIEMEIMPDHVYMRIEVAPQFGINKAVRSVKGYTSSVLRKEFKELTTRLPSLWTNSYFVSTVNNVPQTDIKKYIESQKTSERK
ncbi:IS200/IS605 family transposase [Clostridium sp. E02]|uniref:IS200/IS605 family transposase n=1 Tax=Clostridium sp. E02 TaxID=2487134 RepID=UPI000F528620|nr:IS200/IS605 family transposase [Clostridium sp. E02]